MSPLGKLLFVREHKYDSLFFGLLGGERFRYCFHEAGVSTTETRRKTSRIDELAFEESRSYSLKTEVQLGVRNEWLSTDYDVVFLPIEDGVKRPVHVTYQLHPPPERRKPSKSMWGFTREEDPIGQDDALGSYLLTLDQILADRMAREIASAGQVSWTGPLRLTRDSLDVVGDGRVTTRLFFRDVAKWRIEQGVFALYQRGAEGRPALAVATSDENFFPGLCLFRQLASQ